jgi:hypothetical protein
MDSVKESSFELLPEGTFDAVCVGWAYLGTHKNRFFDPDKSKSDPKASREYQRKVLVVFEVYTSETDPPQLQSDVWTVSLAINSMMRKHCDSWGLKVEGGEIKFDRFLGRPCTIKIAHKKTGQGKDIATVQSIQEYPRGRLNSAPKSQREHFRLDIDKADELTVPDWLPYALGKPVKEMLAESLEWKAKTGSGGSNGNGHAPGTVEEEGY